MNAMAGISPLFEPVKGDKAPYVQIDRIAALAAAAQSGSLEIHPWNCVPNNPEAAAPVAGNVATVPGPRPSTSGGGFGLLRVSGEIQRSA